ncbi:hypothetical protein MUN82_10045 [Hymenobacter aerilatus]|uniref:Uncharacterized protein n=1 Tax=Hymenobacter aerilatus TaxID=2932251 RepID=A0A8T9T470_9BACT|nr:hypothetical protein [Hymenobacter aerilatus]UOR07420.1 hypothetical protein MUN82_10045 [Hymenobacter aerilatus]
MEVYSKQELAPWLKQIEHLTQQVQELVAARPDWIPAEEAQALTGRSRAWFYMGRTAGTLPITMLPRAKGSRRVMYSRKDCIAYGIKHRILPPWYPGEMPK